LNTQDNGNFSGGNDNNLQSQKQKLQMNQDNPRNDATQAWFGIKNKDPLKKAANRGRGKMQTMVGAIPLERDRRNGVGRWPERCENFDERAIPSKGGNPTLSKGGQ